MIIDAFLFKDELDLLEIRLNELGPIVDQFVVVEATKTFAGTDKPLVFAEHAREERFLDWPITHVVVDDMPYGDDRWAREFHQRNAMVRGLTETSDEDVILLSDVDEIPRASMVDAITSPGNFQADRVYSFRQSHYYYYLNALDPEPWWGTKLLTWGNLKTTSPQDQRCVLLRTTHVPVYDGGWHFGWLGDRDAFRQKAKDFCHPDLAAPEITDDNYLIACYESGWTAHNRHKLKFQVIDHTFPKFIRENQERFRRYIR